VEWQDEILLTNKGHEVTDHHYLHSGVALSTTRYAADLDYRLVVVEDCCADQDPAVHDFLTQRVFPRQAEVVNADDVIQALKS
jgi:nicotinamidase-related amidase